MRGAKKFINHPTQHLHHNARRRAAAREYPRADRPLLVDPHHAPITAVSGIPYDDDNVFKKIIEGTVPSYKIFETEHALAFLDAFPMVKGHSLLIPKAVGYASIIDMPADVAANVVKELPRLARVVKEATGCDGVNIVQNNGACAGQVVFHVHFHVLPRWGPDNDGLVRLGKSGDMISKDVASELLQAMQAKL